MLKALKSLLSQPQLVPCLRRPHRHLLKMVGHSWSCTNFVLGKSGKLQSSGPVQYIGSETFSATASESLWGSLTTKLSNPAAGWNPGRGFASHCIIRCAYVCTWLLYIYISIPLPCLEFLFRSLFTTRCIMFIPFFPKDSPHWWKKKPKSTRLCAEIQILNSKCPLWCAVILTSIWRAEENEESENAPNLHGNS